MSQDSKSCRICLKNKPSCISIYEVVLGKYLPELIDNLCGFQISVLDEPDSLSCIDCATALIRAEEIVQKCKQSNEILTGSQTLKRNEAYDMLPVDTALQEEETVIEELPETQNNEVDAIKVEIKQEEAFDSSNCNSDTDGEGATTDIAADHASSLSPTDDIGRVKRKYRKFKKGPRVKTVNRKADFHFKCELCEFESNFAKYFQNHLMEVHDVKQPKVFKCPHCTASYVHYRTMLEHVEREHTEAPKKRNFLCSHCGKGFNRQSHLHQHAFVHKPEERPVKCNECPKLFVNVSSMQRHVAMVHCGVKPFACQLCDKSFALTFNLTAHMKNCHPVETFQCPDCNHIFSKKGNLDTHLLRGTCKLKDLIEYPFACNVCSKGFTQKFRLNKHLKTVHPS